ncbi:hypothetical protein [Dysgonomonas termitidis]|uniref:Uncharacterized protein n=1 Tax=Dysgonomonas termitidis TaxID=1516126 RepID=A0ABV9KTR8_9BACT
MNKPTHIRRNLMLKELDIRWLPNGKRNIFSIKYVDKSGKLRYIPQAYVRGLPYNVQDARQRGIQPCDCEGNAEGHVYPAGIDMIVMYNNMEVIL